MAPFFSILIEYILASTLLVLLSIFSLTVYRVFEFQLAFSRSLILIFVSILVIFTYSNQLNVIMPPVFNGSVEADFLAVASKFILCIFALFYLILISESLKSHKITSFEYYIVFLFAVLGFIVICSCKDLLVFYVSVELASLSLYVLAGFRKKLTYSLDAGIKYFITGATSSGLFLLGSSMLYLVNGSINFADWAICSSPTEVEFQFYIDNFVEWSGISKWDAPGQEFAIVTLTGYEIGHMIENLLVNHMDDLAEIDITQCMEPARIRSVLFNRGRAPFCFNLARVGLPLIVLSLCIKLGLAPFHLWSLNVYEGSPTSSTTFFSILSKLSIFVVFIRLLHTSFFAIRSDWAFFIEAVGVISVFVGSFGGILQKRLKVLFTYSSINNLGLVMFVFSGAALYSMKAVIAFLIIYMVSSLGVWSVIFMMKRHTQKRNRFSKDLGDFAAFKKVNPVGAISYTFSLLSLAGLPPFLGFLAKMITFSALMQKAYLLNQAFLGYSAVFVLFSVISTFYYLRIIKCMFFENITLGLLYQPIKQGQAFILNAVAILTLFLLVNSWIITFITEIVANFGGEKRLESFKLVHFLGFFTNDFPGLLSFWVLFFPYFTEVGWYDVSAKYEFAMSAHFSYLGAVMHKWEVIYTEKLFSDMDQGVKTWSNLSELDKSLLLKKIKALYKANKVPQETFDDILPDYLPGEEDAEKLPERS